MNVRAIVNNLLTRMCVKKTLLCFYVIRTQTKNLADHVGMPNCKQDAKPRGRRFSEGKLHLFGAEMSMLETGWQECILPDWQSAW